MRKRIGVLSLILLVVFSVDYAMAGWEEEPSGADVGFSGVSMVDATNGWAVGSDNDNTRGTIWIYDGTTWAEEANTGATDINFWSVSMVDATDGWAAGWNAIWKTPSLPEAPTVLSATAASATQIDLAWTDNSDNEDGFKIEQAPDSAGAPGTWTEIAQVAAGIVVYSNTSLTAGTIYWYRVRAYNDDGNSGYAAQDSATTSAVGGGGGGVCFIRTRR